MIGLGVYLYIYHAADETRREAYAQAEKIGTKEAGLTKFDKFYMFNGSESWHVITGTDQSGEEIGVWISQKDGTVHTYPLSKGISSNQAIAEVSKTKTIKTIQHAMLGMEKEKPLWEITYLNEKDQLCYSYIDFVSGEWIKNFDNI